MAQFSNVWPSEIHPQSGYQQAWQSWTGTAERCIYVVADPPSAPSKWIWKQRSNLVEIKSKQWSVITSGKLWAKMDDVNVITELNNMGSWYEGAMLGYTNINTSSFSEIFRIPTNYYVHTPWQYLNGSGPFPATNGHPYPVGWTNEFTINGGTNYPAGMTNWYTTDYGWSPQSNIISKMRYGFAQGFSSWEAPTTNNSGNGGGAGEYPLTDAIASNELTWTLSDYDPFAITFVPNQQTFIRLTYTNTEPYYYMAASAASMLDIFRSTTVDFQRYRPLSASVYFATEKPVGLTYTNPVPIYDGFDAGYQEGWNVADANISTNTDGDGILYFTCGTNALTFAWNFNFVYEEPAYRGWQACFYYNDPNYSNNVYWIWDMASGTNGFKFK